jgi:VCBS repeat-containing protein
MDYNKLVYKLGSLHTLLRELEAAEVLQGEHTITYSAADGTQHTLHVYIDGTEFQMSNTPGGTGIGLSTDIFSLD